MHYLGETKRIAETMIKEIRLPLDVELHPATWLRAGDLTCMYELGKLRYIRRGETELIRMIYGAVRNQHWGTLPYAIENERLKVDDKSFSIQFTAVYRQEAEVYRAVFNMEGNADSSISFSMKGVALAAFQKNRIGICVHHPIKTCAGKPVTITHPAGHVHRYPFPELVSPHQPLLDIQQMDWASGDGSNTQLVFEGDIFETEDQRNWSDSSYKTYSTPLHIPFPVIISAGDTMQQTLHLSVTGNKDNVAPALHNSTEEKIAFPKIGYSRSDGSEPLTAAEIIFLQKIPFDHYRVKIIMDEQQWKQALQQAFAEVRQLNTRLQLVLVFSDQFKDELQRLLPLLAPNRALLCSILLLQKNNNFSPADLMSHVYPLIKNVLADIPAGYGTDGNFVDINRHQPTGVPFDFVSYSLYPQAHMTDNRSIFENLDNQPDMIVAAKKFAAGKPVMVGPVTLEGHHNKANADKRQYTAMAAHWTLMSIQQLAMADGITFYETFGLSGLLILQKNQLGQTVSIQPSMVYEVLAALHTFQPVWIIKRYRNDELLMDGLLVENTSGERLFFKAPDEIIHYKTAF